MLHRWEILKEKRREMYEDLMQQKMEEERKFDLIRYIHAVKCIKHIFTLFDQKREKAVTEAKVQFAVNMFAIKFRLWS